MNKCTFHKGDDIAVFGAGPAGLMHMLLAKVFGAGRIFAIDINDFRLGFARRYGAETFNVASEKDIAKKINSETAGRGVDVCIVATGNSNALLQSFELTRRGGKVLLFGVPSRGSQISLDMSRIYSNELSIIPSYAASEIETNQALRMLSEDRIDLGSIITHRFDIKNAVDAVKCAHEAKDAMKVIVTTEGQ
jgi:L-iditol 2-dehydrogenase